VSYGYLTAEGGFVVGGWFWRDTAVLTDWDTLVSQQTQATPAWSGVPGLNGRHLWFGMGAGVGSGFYLTVHNEAGTNLLTWQDPAPSGYFDDSQWHNWALRCAVDKKTWTLFLDGVQFYTTTLATAIDWQPGMLAFGATYAPHLGNWGTYLWSGRVAYTYVIDHEVSDNRIAIHYAAGAGGTVYYGDTEVERIDRVLDWADIPLQAREYDDALLTVQGIAPANTNALEAAHQAAEAASGLILADGQSRIVYHNRRRRYNRASLQTVAESLGSAPEMDIEFTVDDRWVFNDLRGSRPYGSSLRMRNLRSQAEYGRKVIEVTLPVTSHEELINAASWLLNQYGSARVRISGVSFAVESSIALEFLATGGLTVGDVITLDELPEDAPQTTMVFAVDGIGVDADFKDGKFRLKLRLSPQELNNVYQVGVSKLDGTYVIGY
jgi:hypothetical protein